jgi:hypothetical protein
VAIIPRSVSLTDSTSTDCTSTYSTESTSSGSLASMGKVALLSVVLVLVGTGCTGEVATPIDLNSTTTSLDVAGLAVSSDATNAASNQMVLDLARQQCFPRTDQVVNEVVIDCTEARAAADSTSE